jgi:hypothetical protein
MHELDIDDWNNDPEWVELEDLVFSVLSPADVHAMMADWGGTNYTLFIQALGILLRHQEQQKASARRLTLEEMALVRNVGSYTLQ